METLKKTRGITLIALIITIIVLLILAGITINLTIGQSGILNQAQKAGIENEKAQLKEELELAILDIQSEKRSKGQSMKREYLIELDKIGAIVESTGIPAEGQYKDYGFEIDEEYRVTILDKVAGVKPSAEAVVTTQGIVAQGGTVEIKVTASISEGSITEIVATNGATLKTDISATEKVFTVSANGTYTFKVTADNGRSATTSVEVDTIIEKPVIEIKDVKHAQFTIAVTNNYKEGLITQYKYYVGGALKSPTNTTDKEFTVTGLTAETTYENIYVEAYVGEQKLTSEVTSVTTKEQIYEISTPDDLQNMQYNLSGKYCLVNDIDMTGYNFTRIGGSNYFTGILDGQGYTISNLTINDTSEYGSSNYGTGIFRYIKNATIKNILFKNVNVTSQNYHVGLIAGYGYETNTIENVGITGKIEGRGHVGSFIGKTYSYTPMFKNCYARTELISSVYYTGGFVGNEYSGMKLENCYWSGTISNNTGAGSFNAYDSNNTKTLALTNCYYNRTSFSLSIPATVSGTALTTDKFADSSNFANWDFKESETDTEYTWYIDESGFPELHFNK